MEDGSKSFLYQDSNSGNFVIRVRKKDNSDNYKHYIFGYDEMTINNNKMCVYNDNMFSAINIKVLYNSSTNDYRGFITNIRDLITYGDFIAAFPVNCSTVSGPFTLCYQSGAIYIICNSAQTISSLKINYLYRLNV